jgi:hypothetical protein
MNKRAANLAHKKDLAILDQKIIEAKAALYDFAENHRKAEWAGEPRDEAINDAWNAAHDTLSALEGERRLEVQFHRQRMSGVSEETARLVFENID